MTVRPEATFIVEYPCEQHCRVEVDMAAIHMRFTHRQMLNHADGIHEERHAPPPEPTPIHDEARLVCSQLAKQKAP